MVFAPDKLSLYNLEYLIVHVSPNGPTNSNRDFDFRPRPVLLKKGQEGPQEGFCKFGSVRLFDFPLIDVRGRTRVMDAALWWRHSDSASCTAKSLALFGLLIGLVVYWALAFVAWQPEGRGRRGWKARIVQKARNALQERRRGREGGGERETTRISSSPGAGRTPAMPKAAPAPDVRSDLARRKPSLEGKPRAAALRSPEGISLDAARSRPEGISLDAARSRPEAEPRAAGRRSLEAEPRAESRRSRRDTVVPPARSDVQRAQRRQPEPYPSAESPAASARGERGDAGHRVEVKEHPAGARRLRLVRHEVANTAGQADVMTKGGELAHTSPHTSQHSRSFQTLACLRRHKSAPVSQSTAVASRAFARTPSGRVAGHGPFDPRLRLTPEDDDNDVAFTAHRLHRDWHMDGRHNRSAPSVFLVPGSKEQAREAISPRCSPLRLSKGAAHGPRQWTCGPLPRSASFASARMMVPVVPDWYLWFQDILRGATKAKVRSVARATRAKARAVVRAAQVSPIDRRPCETQGMRCLKHGIGSEDGPVNCRVDSSGEGGRMQSNGGGVARKATRSSPKYLFKDVHRPWCADHDEHSSDVDSEVLGASTLPHYKRPDRAKSKSICS
jgi:hypothetical protein